MRSFRTLMMTPLLALFFVGCGDDGKKPRAKTDSTYSVSGVVRTEAGVGIAGVSLDFGGESATTAADGTWSASDLEGSVIITPSLVDHLFAPESRTVTGAQADVVFVGYPESESYTVSGTVETAAGTPLEGVVLEFSGAGTAVSLADGTWSKSRLVGSVTISPTHPEYSFAPSSQKVTGAETGIVFIGTSTSAPYQVDGVVLTRDGTGLEGVVLDFGEAGTATTAADGSWSMGDLMGAVTITPSHATHTFFPVSQIVTQSETGITFTANTVRKVGAGQEYATVQSAIDAALSGDVVEILPGRYEENLLIDNKAITLRGSSPLEPDVVDATMIVSQEGSQVLLVVGRLSSGTVVQGLSFSGPGQGIFVFPLEIEKAETPLTRDDVPPDYSVRIEHNLLDGRGERQIGLRLSASILHVEGNRVYGHDYGIVVLFAVEAKLIDNHVRGHGVVGIMVAFSEETTLAGNVIEDNRGRGFEYAYDTVEPGETLILTGNTIRNNLGSGATLAVDGGEVVIENNEFAMNESASEAGGLMVTGEDLGNVVVTGNQFDRNISVDGFGGGIQVQGAGGAVVVTDNVFYGNSAKQKAGGAIAVGGSCSIVDDDEVEIESVGSNGKDSGGNEYSLNAPDDIHFIP